MDHIIYCCCQDPSFFIQQFEVAEEIFGNHNSAHVGIDWIKLMIYLYTS